MNITEIFLIFGVTGTVFMGAVAYLIKTLTNHLLDKDFETFKLKLNIESERDKIQYSILQQQRAQVISKLYSLLAKFDKSARDLMAFFQPAGTPSESEKSKIAAEDGNRFNDYYSENKIYFDKETCYLIDNINEKFRKIWIDFQFRDRIPAKTPEDDLWLKSWKTLTEEIPMIREKLEETFRKILGINTIK